MPPCPCQRTGGTLSTGVFPPCGVTSQTGPTFSVMSIRPSGRNAMRHGRLNVATWVMVNGSSGSGFKEPALVCVQAGADASKDNSTALKRAFMHLLLSNDVRGRSRVRRIGAAVAPNRVYPKLTSSDPRSAKLAKAATSPGLRQAFELHLEEMRGHVERLEQVFELLDEKVKGKHCEGIA